MESTTKLTIQPVVPIASTTDANKDQDANTATSSSPLSCASLSLDTITTTTLNEDGVEQQNNCIENGADPVASCTKDCVAAAAAAAEFEQQPWFARQRHDRMYWLDGFRADKKGGLLFLDHDALKKQQSVIKDIALQVGAQLLRGKLAVRISLPIRVFEPRSFLDRLVDNWGYAPTLMTRAALQQDPLERMKWSMAFILGGLHFCLGKTKPFNPIIGETFQATFPDGTQVTLEHVSHHPPRTAFHLVGPNAVYQMYGVYELEAISVRNSVVTYERGTTKIVFADNHVLTFTLPQLRMSGMLLGDRVIELVGTCTFRDEANQLVGEINCEANSKFMMKTTGDDLKGHIIHQEARGKRILSRIQGSWLSRMIFDGKLYWQIETEPVFQAEPVANPLPSDVRFRDDITALKTGDAETAQTQKLRLEEIQRNDIKLREAAKEARLRRQTPVPAKAAK